MNVDADYYLTHAAEDSLDDLITTYDQMSFLEGRSPRHSEAFLV